MKNRSYVYVLEVVTSLLLVGGLFYAGFFVTPVVHVKKIEKYPFERRDCLYSVIALDDKGQSLCTVGSYGKILRSEDGGATWTIQKTPTQAHLQKVVAWDKNTLLAIGDNATVLTTNDAGKSWKTVKIPTYERGDVLLTAFLEPGSGRAWIAGNMGMVLVSDDKGATWRMVHPQEDISWNSIAIT
ncbi:glycosyl hydrolase, partial [bacterium]